VDTLNPSIVRRGGIYYNFYSGYDGRAWHTGLAVSKDGLAWERQGKVLSPGPAAWEGGYIAANGSAMVVDGQFYYWYQAAGRRAWASPGRRTDGRGRNCPNPCSRRTRGSWTNATSPIRTSSAPEGTFTVLSGRRPRAPQRLGVAMSSDGVKWYKLRSNPILELGPRERSTRPD